ncbi:MAG: indolepyruvate ferredoxin oxidoreductase family protein [Hyphomicrobiales bacterium]
MTLKDVKLDDKFDLTKQHILISGVQAIVRLTMMQHERDRKDGLNTAGYVTGYRGSPVGTVDLNFLRASKYLEPYNIVFEPGLNEDLAATALWGTQQAEMRGEGAFDGVFGIWYGKGPGVDRSCDPFRHANAAGTSKHGGVLVLMGDDHTAESSTVPHQSEFALVDMMMPVLNPSGVQEIIDYGILGWALSRYSGCWVGLKCIHDNVESTAVVDGALDRIEIKTPTDFEMPEGGINIRPWDDRHESEIRLHTHKRFAATAFARANNLNTIPISGGQSPKIGIVTAGKSYLDTRQALEELGIDEIEATKLGVRLLKVGMVWPLDPEIVETFAKGLDLIIVIEEKRSLLETQIKEQLYGRKNAPAIIGKKDENNETLFQAHGALDTNVIAIELAKRLLKDRKHPVIEKAVKALTSAQNSLTNLHEAATRIPYFCAGCPHNSSTVVPEGGRGYAGIGCHWMAQFVGDRNTEGATHMGAEGTNWVGERHFSTRKHVFQNLGDGTYNHSGILAIRAAIAAGANMTYKILYNDAVAMTGGQAHEGQLTVPMIARQVAAEGAKRVVVVSDEPDKYPGDAGFPPHTTLYHRREIQTVQKELMETEGVTVLIYDQTCAAEKRRRRKRGTFPDPAKRVFINELVCEGCGDCGAKSNCVAIQPVETEFGRKRRIDQSSCNKDYSCVNGFCPSFVTIEGGELRATASKSKEIDVPVFEALPEAELPSLENPWAILVTGIGGTGVVTVGQVMAMAAHLEGKGAGIIDMAGLSQKNGAVVSHLKIAKSPEDIASIRVAAGGAELLLGCDLVTSASEENLAAVAKGHTKAVVNDFETMPAMFTQDADYKLPGDELRLSIEARTGPEGTEFVNATKIATALMGDSIATNMFTLGFAWQRGLIPLSHEALEQAIRMNGVAIDMNLKAFEWGRRAAHNLPAVEKIIAERSQSTLGSEISESHAPSNSLDEMIARRVAFLTAYQNADYAARYNAFVAKVRTKEESVKPGSENLATAVARYLFKLMAYKDEYEVARLYTDTGFKRAVAERFSGDYVIKHHMAPPIFSKRDPETGHLIKKEFGPWMMNAFGVLTTFKFLRGTAFDPFGYSSERKQERALIGDYENTIDELLGRLATGNLDIATEIAGLPEFLRGYGHVKERHLEEVKEREHELLEALRSGRKAPAKMAAE